MNNRFIVDLYPLDFSGGFLVTVIDNDISDYVIREHYTDEAKATARYDQLCNIYGREYR